MIFERYIFKNLAIATVFIALTLAAIILLTQSLRFLELVINSGASSMAFWGLTMLALPRFFEIILPIALMAAVVFVYNKLIMDSEMVVMRSAGFPPLVLARPALALSGVTAVLLLVMTMWLAPVSLASMHEMRQVIKAQYSTLLFREGVFNAIQPGLMVFVRERESNGELRGLIIHDSRKDDQPPVTVLAKRGVVVAEDAGQQVVVYDGSRQDFKEEDGTLNRLDFKRYSIDLPDGGGVVRQRWREPDERTFWELLHPDPENERDVESQHEFVVEAHRRIASPLLAPAFVSIAICFLLLGPLERRGLALRIVMAIMTTVVVQALYLGAFSIAKQSVWGLPLMYLLVFLPIGIGYFMLSGASETMRRKIFFGAQGGAA